MAIPVQKAFVDIFGNAANTLSFPDVCGTGNSILVIGIALYTDTSTFLTIADDQNNSYSLVAQYQPSSGLNQIQVWLATNIKANTQAVTLTDPLGVTFMGIGMWELPNTWAL